MSVKEETLPKNILSLDANKIDNAVLKRLIAEVKSHSQNNIAYNRIHRRHNRSAIKPTTNGQTI